MENNNNVNQAKTPKSCTNCTDRTLLCHHNAKIHSPALGLLHLQWWNKTVHVFIWWNMQERKWSYLFFINQELFLWQWKATVLLNNLGYIIFIMSVLSDSGVDVTFCHLVWEIQIICILSLKIRYLTISEVAYFKTTQHYQYVFSQTTTKRRVHMDACWIKFVLDI